MKRSSRRAAKGDYEFLPSPFSGHYDDDVEAAWAQALPGRPSRVVPLLSLLYVTHAVVNRFHARVLKQFQISFIEYAILNTLILNSKGLKPSIFKNLLGLPSAHVTQILQRMEKRHLLVREKNPDDKRSVLISLSSKGEEMAVAVCEAVAAESEKLAAGTPETEIKELRGALLRVIDVMS